MIMSKLAIPSFSFPTTIWFIDDNIEFLKSVAIGLSPETAIYNFYSDSKKALSILNERHGDFNPASGLVSQVDEEEFEHRTIDVNVRDLYLMMYNKNRFNKVSTVVVDYHMPGINGIEFCRSIKNPNIQKILLTSIVDEKKAIEVLNEGLIDGFIRKQSPNIMELINQSIKQAQVRYFLQLSQIINQIANFSKDETALFEPGFIELFYKICHEFKAVEFYLTEWLGSFVFLDSFGNNFGLMTRTKEQISSFCESSQAESAPAEVLALLKKSSHILCYHNEKNHSLPEGHMWEQYLFLSKKVFKNNQYLCSYAPQMFDIKKEKLISFDRFSNEIGLNIN